MKKAFHLQARAHIQTASDQGDGPRRRRFSIIASTGEPLRGQAVNGWAYPVIVDLEGIECSQQMPVLDNHGPRPDSDRPMRLAVVGQTDRAGVKGSAFEVEGDFFEKEPAAKDIIRLADQGMKWQASIGASCLERDFVAERNEVQVNGRTYEGPLYVSRKTLVREVSFVVIGDDPKTSVVVASGTGGPLAATLMPEGNAVYYVSDDRVNEVLATIEAAGAGYVTRRLDRGLTAVLTDAELAGLPGETLSRDEAVAADYLACRAGGIVGGTWAQEVGA